MDPAMINRIARRPEILSNHSLQTAPLISLTGRIDRPAQTRS